MPRKRIVNKESIIGKLEYIGLDLDNIPKKFRESKVINFRPPKYIEGKQQYKQYKYIPIKEIEILLTPTNRLNSLQEKYKMAEPLAEYLDNKTEKNLLKHTTFLRMLNQVKISDIEKVEEEQEKLSEKIPFKVKFEGNYLWQIYYSEENKKYFMLVTIEDSDYSTFFYILKKQLEESEEQVFVPISGTEYSKKFYTKPEIEEIENCLWILTKDWPLIYEVTNSVGKYMMQIIGETNIYGKIKTQYRLIIKTPKQAIEIYRLLKLLFILQTDLPNYFEFRTSIGKTGEIEFYLKNKKIDYENIKDFIKEEYIEGETRKQEIALKIDKNHDKLEELKEIEKAQEAEYLEKEKQIATFLECKRTFLGKFKYYFKYGKKKKESKKGNIESSVNTKVKRKNKKEEYQDVPEEEIEKIKTSLIKKEKFKESYSIEELIAKYKDLEKVETNLRNINLDINAIKLKNKNVAKKIENATSFIDEIDKHKRSIFEFWKYSNKDEVSSLPEGEEEEVNVVKRIHTVFDYDEDFEQFGKNLDQIQRKKLTNKELDSIYVTTTNLLNLVNQIKTNSIVPKDLENNLKEMKKKEILEDTDEKEEEAVFGGIMQRSKIGNFSHRELPKNLIDILEITKTTKTLGYKLALENVLKNVKKAMGKITLLQDVTVYKAVINDTLNLNELQVFNLNPEKELEEALEQAFIQEKTKISFYRLDLKQGENAIGYTNSVFYNNQNKTLPIGMDLSTKMLIDFSKLDKDFKKTMILKVLKFEDEKDDFSRIKIKAIPLYEALEE